MFPDVHPGRGTGVHADRLITGHENKDIRQASFSMWTSMHSFIGAFTSHLPHAHERDMRLLCTFILPDTVVE